MRPSPRILACGPIGVHRSARSRVGGAARRQSWPAARARVERGVGDDIEPALRGAASPTGSTRAAKPAAASAWHALARAAFAAIAAERDRIGLGAFAHDQEIVEAGGADALRRWPALRRARPAAAGTRASRAPADAPCSRAATCCTSGCSLARRSLARPASCERAEAEALLRCRCRGQARRRSSDRCRRRRRRRGRDGGCGRRLRSRGSGGRFTHQLQPRHARRRFGRRAAVARIAAIHQAATPRLSTSSRTMSARTSMR